MTEREKNILAELISAITQIPTEAQARMLGYAQAIIDMKAA